MAERYTAADFANARFAEHPDGGAGAHRRPDGWVLGSEARHSDADMARAGWVPVPTKPTITKSGAVKVFEASKSGIGGTRTALTQLGIEIIPDPEPTNTDKLEKLIRESYFTVSGDFGGTVYGSFAKYLDSRNVYVKDN